MKDPIPDSASATVLAARAEASAWITRLHGPDRTPEIEAGFRRWLAERPENAQEFEGLNEVWDLLSASAPARHAPRLERWEHSAEARELQVLRAQSTSSAAARRRRPHVALVWVICAVLAMCIVGFYWWAWPRSAYSTAIGEQRVVRLKDGTRLSLNSGSDVSTDFSGTERRVRLNRGEVLFEVAKDARRPFVVTTGGRSVTALGTTFVVRRDARQMTVTLIEGKVAVADTAKRSDIAASAPDILVPGQRLTLGAATSPRIDTPRLEAVTAWRRGEVILDNTPLADAVAEMNRYDQNVIVIDNPKAAGLIVSGLYHTGDSIGFAKSVARLHGLHLRQTEGQIHLE